MTIDNGQLTIILAGPTQQSDKLVFEREHCKLPVIANQCAHWCGNPPVRGKMYRQLPRRTEKRCDFGGNCYLVPFNRGIATPVCALARNDSFFKRTLSNTNLSGCWVRPDRAEITSGKAACGGAPGRAWIRRRPWPFSHCRCAGRTAAAPRRPR